jgi:hypothetical protein
MTKCGDAVTHRDGMCLTRESDGTTRVDGPVVDQAALYGLLQRA